MADHPGAQEAPGSAFLRRRLERASAVPPAERSPEVAAFVESARLAREACELLPLTATGQPALQAGATLQRQLLLALAKLAKAELLCLAPMTTVADCNPGFHVGAYLEHIRMPRRQHAELAGALLSYTVTRSKSVSDDQPGAVTAGSQLVAMLEEASVQRAFDQQMRQLSGDEQPPLLTARQLLYTSCRYVALGGRVEGHAPGLSEHAATRHNQAVAKCSEAMLRLEPDQPQSWTTAAVQQLPPHTHAQRAVEMYLHAFQLAQQQRSNWWTLQAGASAVIHAAQYCFQLNAATLEAALETMQHLEPALQRCRRLLPTMWAKHIEAMAVAAQGCAARIQKHLQDWQLLQQLLATQSLQPLSSGAARAAEYTADADPEQTIQRFLEQRSCNCHGCGNEALGLRKCGRCKQAQYCRYVAPCSCCTAS
jgi:hypothetical protein